MLFPRCLRLLLDLSKDNCDVAGLHNPGITSNLSLYVKSPFLGPQKGNFNTHRVWCVDWLALQLTLVSRPVTPTPEPSPHPRREGLWAVVTEQTANVSP